MEAPRHTTLTIVFEKDDQVELEADFDNYLDKKVQERIADFDVDETFEEMWSISFGEHNGFTPRDFMQILEDDKEYFESLYGETETRQERLLRIINDLQADNDFNKDEDAKKAIQKDIENLMEALDIKQADVTAFAFGEE